MLPHGELLTSLISDIPSLTHAPKAVTGAISLIIWLDIKYCYVTGHGFLWSLDPRNALFLFVCLLVLSFFMSPVLLYSCCYATMHMVPIFRHLGFAFGFFVIVNAFFLLCAGTQFHTYLFRHNFSPVIVRESPLPLVNPLDTFCTILQFLFLGREDTISLLWRWTASSTINTFGTRVVQSSFSHAFGPFYLENYAFAAICS